MISSPSGSPKNLVFRRQISSPNSKAFPPNGGLKQGSVGKIHNCRAVAWRPYMLRRQTATFYPRDAMLARVIVIATCLSVCLSVTRRYCVKTKKGSGMISSPSGSPKNLVFRRQISSPNSKGFPPNGDLKQGSVGKIQ